MIPNSNLLSGLLLRRPLHLLQLPGNGVQVLLRPVFLSVSVRALFFLMDRLAQVALEFLTVLRLRNRIGVGLPLRLLRTS